MSNYQHIYNRLRGYGLSEAGAVGVLGNLEAESNCESVRVQGDYSSDRAKSKEYTREVDSGEMSAHIFAYDQKGYGLPQWTFFQRKANMLRAAKIKGVSIGDLDFQIDFLVEELKTDFSNLYEFLTSSNNIYSCTDRVCREFENPAVKNVDARYQLGLKIRMSLDLAGSEDTGTAEEDHSWTPKTLTMSNAYQTDCVVLQAILNARHFPCGSVDGFYGAKTQAAVNSAQKHYGLTVDGVCGQATWNALKWGD